MEQALQIAACVVISGMLIWGCVTDIKIREVSNWVSLFLLIAGFFTPHSWAYRGISVGIVILTFVIGAVMGMRHGMGDIKVITALSFAVGMFGTMLSLVIGGLIAVVYGWCKHLPAKRNIPLVSYLCFGYHVYLIAEIVFVWLR